MATKHWARDAIITDPTNYIANGNQPRANALVYHYLRNAGMDLIWECDGEVGPYDTDCNHVDDGAMEESGTAKWQQVGGGIVTKDTVTVRSGAQSLSILAITPGDGAQSVAMRSMLRAGRGNVGGGPNPNWTMTDATNRFSQAFNGVPGGTYNITISGAVTYPGLNGTWPISGMPSTTGHQIDFLNGAGGGENNLDYATDEPYEVDFWANNLAPGLWNVEVDRGNGVWALLGTIPVVAGWNRYNFSFTLTPGDDGTNPRYIRFVEPTFGSGSQLYVDELHVYRSLFEGYALNQYGSDGIVTNPDTFSTAGSYAPGAADVGKWLFIWDAANPLNSGWYKIITDLGGGSVQVDLRSPTAAFTTNSPLNYRIVEIEGQWSNYDYDYGRIAAGFGLESPHSSAWRFFMRLSMIPGQNNKAAVMWGAPEDTDFNADTGEFYQNGPSTSSRIDTGPYDTSPSAYPQLMTRGPYTYKTSPTVTRTFLMTDEDLSFFTMDHWGDDGKNGYYFAGYTGADSGRPGIMEWMIASGYNNTWGSADEISWDSGVEDFGYSGSGFAANGQCIATVFGADLGYDSALHAFEQSNAGPNPWSGNEWLQSPIIAIDPEGDFGQASEGDADCGIYKTRYNRSDLTTFESDTYLHCANGLVWEWSGEQLAP